MKRIDTSTAVSGRFVDGNKTTGRKATQFSAEWCNQIQEELWNAISGLTGSSPTGLSEDELKKAFLDGISQMILKSLSVRTFNQGGVLLIKLEDGKLSLFHGTTSSEETTEIDYESVSTDTVKAKAIKGMTPIGDDSFKLVVKTNMDIGDDESPLKLTVFGDIELNGLFTSGIIVGTQQSPANVTVRGDVDCDDVVANSLRINELRAKTGGGEIAAKHVIVQEKQSKIEGVCFRNATEDHDGLWLASNHGANQNLYAKELPDGSVILVVNDTAHSGGSVVNVSIQYQNGATLELTPNQSKLFYRMGGEWYPIG